MSDKPGRKMSEEIAEELAGGFQEYLDKKVKLLTRALVEQTAELKTEIVDVPEWGGAVLIRELTGEERDDYEAEIVGERTGKDRRINLRNIRAKLVARSLIDPETNQRMYSDREIGILGRKSAKALNRVFEACQRLSGLTDEDVKELETAMVAHPNESSGTP